MIYRWASRPLWGPKDFQWQAEGKIITISPQKAKTGKVALRTAFLSDKPAPQHVYHPAYVQVLYVIICRGKLSAK